MSNDTRWAIADIPVQSGRVAIVTGANSGLGSESALALAAKGAHVVLACRDAAKAQSALQAIRAASPAVSVEAMALDLASLASVRAFAEAFVAQHERLDLLCNNAGVMAIPHRRTTDGFEMQFGTNHLGHFALTGLLLPRLLDTPGARVVSVSSSAHRPGKIHWDDLQLERSYRNWRAYAQSKLANLLFAFELDRRLRKAGTSVISVAAHPGYAATNLQSVGARMAGSRVLERLFEVANRLIAQSAAMGALPTLYAATAPEVQGGDYFGPASLGEMWGHPRKVRSSARSKDLADAARLWKLSEALTDVRFAALA
ncbi:MAG: short-chain dehydrogenase/reductase [Deltaproteobacteria bacterium]|nr:short-chain dehydrogenase/reductase [Deltaproteobacteria bacterium]